MHRMLNYHITAMDVTAVLDANEHRWVADIEDTGEYGEDLYSIFTTEDRDRIEVASMKNSNDPEEQCNAAIEEITDLLTEMGILTDE